MEGSAVRDAVEDIFSHFSGHGWTCREISTRSGPRRVIEGETDRAFGWCLAYTTTLVDSSPLMWWMVFLHAFPCMFIHNGTNAASNANLEVMDCLLTNLTQRSKSIVQLKKCGDSSLALITRGEFRRG